MHGNTVSHEDLQKNIPDLTGKPENGYLYYEGYVYYSLCKSGSRDATGWVGGGEVYKRAKEDGTEITTFDNTFEQSVETASSSHIYRYATPVFADGYVHFKIKYTYNCDWADEEVTWLTFKVKADGISDLEEI